MTIRYGRQARLELAEAVAFYERRRPGLGREFDQTLAKLLQQAVETPGRFQLITPLVRKARMKRFPCFAYFTEMESAIQVIAALYARRHPEWIVRRLAE
jgi:plasmid stabilization system protein ParE